MLIFILPKTLQRPMQSMFTQNMQFTLNLSVQVYYRLKACRQEIVFFCHFYFYSGKEDSVIARPRSALLLISNFFCYTIATYIQHSN